MIYQQVKVSLSVPLLSNQKRESERGKEIKRYRYLLFLSFVQSLREHYTID